MTHRSSWWLHRNLRSWDGSALAPYELPQRGVFLARWREQQQKGLVVNAALPAEWVPWSGDVGWVNLALTVHVVGQKGGGCELLFWWTVLSGNTMNLWPSPAAWVFPFLRHSLLGQRKAVLCLPSTRAFSTSSPPTARLLLPSTSHYRSITLSFSGTFIKSLSIFLPPAHSFLL